MPRLSRAGAEPQVTIDAGASYELLLSLATVTETDNYSVAEVGAQWLAAARERAGEELMQRLDDFSQGTGDFFVHLVPLAYEAPRPNSVANLLDHLAAVEPRDLLLLMVAYYDYHMRRTTPPEVMRAAVEGDQRARDRFIADSAPYPRWQAVLGRVLLREPEQVRDELVALLGDWYGRVWREEEPTVLPILERDADAKRDLATELPFDRFVEVATNGVQFVPHAGIDRLVLIPSWVNRPWVSYSEYGGAMFLCYPVADESLVGDADAPPLRLVRLTKALGDEKRLRILRALSSGPRSLMELAEQFDVPKTTMHHHMVTLRSAGLVSVGAGSKDYRLRADALPSLSQMLGGYLAAGGTTEPATPARPARPTRIAAPTRRGRPAAATGRAANSRRGN